MTLRMAHISDIHVARQTEKSAEADVSYLRSYMKRVLPVARAVGGASVLAGYAWKHLDDKEFRKKYVALLEQLRSAGEKLDVRMVMGLVIGLLGASMGLAFFYRRELMKLLSSLQYRERKEMREILLESLGEQRPDVVLITGDFTTVASEGEFQEAKSFVDQIRDFECRPLIIIIPGNHDVEDARRGEKHARLDTYARVFSEYLPKTIVPLKADFGDVVLYGVNSNTVGRGLGTDGRVGAKTLEFLKNELPSTKNKGNVLAVHHHLAKYGHEPRLPPLENAQDLLEVAQEGGVQLICHGHKHELFDWQYEQEIDEPSETDEPSKTDALRVVCAGSSTEATTWKPDRLNYKMFTFDNGYLVDPLGEMVTQELEIDGGVFRKKGPENESAETDGDE